MPRETRSKLYALIDETSTSHRPINITRKRGNAVLLSEDDWNAINETLHLLSIPGMHESIREGKDVEFDQRNDWERLALTSY
ncbi:type II toxin-antitoxin system Phd/YefM family antitoxin [Zhongshania sp. BJYM1]|uniref:type II toxin-antitoxin system Phd/YefM family antitoxin n=1 Tax=Zhongshania aquatica TaxID=2965069 RepID=UPI0022B4A90B|nr:type II toxin-antitoxin system Phd/YefM family antitoxin [Marortus sp. BJYM1]